MASKNEHTGAVMKSKTSNEQYRNGWDAIFAKNKLTENVHACQDNCKTVKEYDFTHDGSDVRKITGAKMIKKVKKNA